MHCLGISLLLLTTLFLSAFAVWKWYGFGGLLILLACGFALLVGFARFGPRLSAAVFRRMFRQMAGPMRNAVVTVHGIEPADPPDRVEEAIRAVEGSIDQHEQENEPGGLDIDVSEFLRWSQINLEQARYQIDVTIVPPESHTDAEWAPYEISLVPLGPFGNKVEVELFDETSAEFRPFRPEDAFATVRGTQRLRLLVDLDPSHSEYRLEYMHVNPLDATIRVPPPAWDEPPVRRFTAQILDRILRRKNVRRLSFCYLPITDADLPKLSNLSELETLSLDRTQISNEGLKHIARLRQLQYLGLDGTNIGDEGLMHLSELARLERLDVRETAVGDAGLEKLRHAIPKLKIMT